MSSEEKITVKTGRFGEITVDASKKIEIIGGLLGFPASTGFIILDHHEPDSPFKWLQSLDDGDLAFVITDPLIFFPDYRIQIRKEELVNLDVSSVEDLVIFVVLSLHSEITDMTANLQGPIIVNAKSRIGRQIVLKESGYMTKHQLFVELGGQGTVEETPQEASK